MNVWMELQLHSSRREEMLTRQKYTEKIKRTIMEIVQITGFFISLFKKKKWSEGVRRCFLVKGFMRLKTQLNYNTSGNSEVPKETGIDA